MKRKTALSAQFGVHTWRNGTDLYDVPTLIVRSRLLPVQKIAWDLVLYMLQWDSCWTDPQGRGTGPKALIKAYKKSGGKWSKMISLFPQFVEHIEKLRSADLRYPLIFSLDNPQRQLTLADGMHRLVKAFLLGKPYLRGRIFENNPPEALILPEKA